MASLSPNGIPVLCLAFLAAPAMAQVIPTGTPAADILLAAAISDQRVFLTCTALEPESHQIALAFWQADVAAAVTILTDNAVPAEAIAAFTTAAAPQSLLPAPDTPFADIQAYCSGQEQWFPRWNRRDFTELAAQLPEAFE